MVLALVACNSVWGPLVVCNNAWGFALQAAAALQAERMRRALEARAVVAQVAEQKEAGRAALAAAQVTSNCRCDYHEHLMQHSSKHLVSGSRACILVSQQSDLQFH